MKSIASTPDEELALRQRLCSLLDNRSQEDVAKILGISEPTVNKYAQKYGLSRSHRESRLFRYARRRSPLHREEIEVIEGLLLSDGSLHAREGGNARLTLGFKHCGVVDTLSGMLPHLDLSTPRPQMARAPNSTRETRSWHSYSVTHPQLTELYRRWYPDGRRRLPKGFRLNPTHAHFWYIGDGSLHKIWLNIQIYGYSWGSESLANLANQLDVLGFEAMPHSWGVRIPRRRVGDFLRWIGPPCIEEYEYKWAWHPPLSKEEANRRRSEGTRKSWEDPQIRAQRLDTFARTIAARGVIT